VSKNDKKITINVIQHDDMISYDIYDRFTMEHFPLRQRMTLTTVEGYGGSTLQKSGYDRAFL
jgi:hypothetical protein